MASRHGAEQATIQWALSPSMPTITTTTTMTKQKDMELLEIRELISMSTSCNDHHDNELGQAGLALGVELCELAEEHEHDVCVQALEKMFGHHTS
jgi:hypothetical protein